MRSRKEREALPSPTVHSAEHGAVAVAEAEAVEGPLPADHYGQPLGAVREARFAHPGHLPLLPQPPGCAVGNRSAAAVRWASPLQSLMRPPS